MFNVFVVLLLFFLNLDSHTPFITNREKSDLEITQLINALDSTYTLHGRKALEKLLEPTYDIAIIKERQSILQLLLENTALCDQLESWLLKTKTYESEITAYLEKKQDTISLQAEPLYFQQLLEGNFFKKVATFCNKYPLILEGSILKQLWNSFYPIILQLGAAGIAFKYNQWLFEQTNHFEWWEGFKLGLEKPIKDHSWTPYLTQEKVESHDTGLTSHLLYTKAFLNGSLRDRYEVAKSGFNSRTYFYKDWSFAIGHNPLSQPIAFLMALSVTAFSDIVQGFSILSAWRSFASQYSIIQVLKKQLYYLKKYLDHIHDLPIIINHSNNPALLKSVLIPLSPFNSDQLKELEAYLSKRTFNSPDGHFYRRGLVLWMHKKVSEFGSLTDHYVRQVGIIDAYMSIARLIKNLQANNFPVCFASFEKTPNICHIENGWILTTPDKCIQNTIELGLTSPRAIILSGPHGCGKSTILKLLGHVGVLSHSIGISFSSKTTISELQGIRTSFSTDSVSEKGLSTFMAAQQAIQQIQEFMKHITHNQTGMILLSEPYKGTVEAEAAYRINQFCTEYFLKHPTIIMGLESHVFAPIELAKKFPQSFANKQMTIKLLDNGTFERTFLMSDGAADWWFENNQLRSQYVDWINDFVKRRN